ncbi:MAG: 1-phosphofructokinase [Lachnospiraceae bacterium]|nr:1-phosphofructokinase [Lachnospiraceae bacterium]
MIYTVTLNPSLDYFVSVDNFQLGRTNRTSSELVLPGGKGINVSVVLSNLGLKTTAIYYSAGFVGEEITRLIKTFGINAEGIKIPEGSSRINMKLTSVDGTEINGMGPAISSEKLDILFEKMDDLTSDDILILGGKVPDSVPSKIYSDIMRKLSDRGIPVVVDATKDLLTNVLPYNPFLIKPNNFELSEIFGVEITTKEQAIHYAKQMQSLGARNIIVSFAADGAVMLTEDGDVYESEAPKGELVSSVGAGDSMVAGFLYGYSVKKDMEYAFHMGLAAGSASAFSRFLATGDEVKAVYERTFGKK